MERSDRKDKLPGIRFQFKIWDEPIAAQYGVEAIPATFILDASGKIVQEI
jgi:hypothetical protein